MKTKVEIESMNLTDRLNFLKTQGLKLALRKLDKRYNRALDLVEIAREEAKVEIKNKIGDMIENLFFEENGEEKNGQFDRFRQDLIHWHER